MRRRRADLACLAVSCLNWRCIRSVSNLAQWHPPAGEAAVAVSLGHITDIVRVQRLASRVAVVFRE